MKKSNKYSERIEQLQKGLRGNWKEEGYSLYHTYVPPQEGEDPPLHIIEAHHPKHGKVGEARFESINNRLVPQDFLTNSVQVDKNHRRKGIASAMYSHAEAISRQSIVPSNNQSPAGKKLWSQKNRSFGKSEDLLKYEGKIKSFKNAAAGLAAAATMASAQPAQAQEAAPQRNVQSVQRQEVQKPTYNKDHILRSIAMVESSGGKDTKHEKLPKGGIHKGERAFGNYGLTPLLIRETAKLNRDINTKHPELSKLRGADMHEYMKANPNLQHDIASSHYDRLSKHFGHDPSKIAHAWLNGITGTKKALKNGSDLQNHWHVQKIRKALDKVMNGPQKDSMVNLNHD